MTPSIHVHKAGSRILFLAIGIAVVFGTLSPASTDVKAETASAPYINGLVNPAYARLPMSAREIPERRTEKTAVFQVGTDKYAAISFGSPMFTDVDGKWLPIDQSGRREGNSYIFDRLAEGVDITFDLTRPQYTLIQNGQGFTVAFAGGASATIIDDHSIAYTLADGITLTWTVNGNHVLKEIFVSKPNIARDIAFTIAPTTNLHLQESDQILSLVDSQNNPVFSFDSPFLAQADGVKLDPIITLKKTGNQYQYVFDESKLLLPYIIDPSSGPNSPGTLADDQTFSGNPWSNVNNAMASDDTYATATIDFFAVTNTSYLKATNFGFSIPTGATINGVVAAVEGKVTDVDGADGSIKLVKGGTIQGDDKVRAYPYYYWPASDDVMVYGANNDLWGLALTDTDINASNFGFVVSVNRDGGGGGPVSIDHMTLTVYYTASGGEGGGGGTGVPAISFTSGGIALAGFLWSRRRSKTCS